MTALMLATHHHYYDDHHWFPFFPLIPLFFFGFWVLLFALLRPWRWRYAGARSGESILAERFARGEIDEQEYKSRRTSLRNKD